MLSERPVFAHPLRLQPTGSREEPRERTGVARAYTAPLAPSLLQCWGIALLVAVQNYQLCFWVPPLYSRTVPGQ
jgi:hypothetical protein